LVGGSVYIYPIYTVFSNAKNNKHGAVLTYDGIVFYLVT